MPITHDFVSGVADGSDAAQVQPSDWNAAHVGDTPQVMLNSPAAPGEGADIELILDLNSWVPTGGDFEVTLTDHNSVDHVLVIPFDASVAEIDVLLDAEFGAGVATAALVNPAGGQIAVTALADGGADWEVGDEFSLGTAGAEVAGGVVDAIDGGGAVTAYHMTDGGADNVVEAAVAAQFPSGIGTGLLIDIVKIDCYPISPVFLTIPAGNDLLPIATVVDVSGLTTGGTVNPPVFPTPDGQEAPPLATVLGSQVVYSEDGTDMGEPFALYERLSLSGTDIDWVRIWP